MIYVVQPGDSLDRIARQYGVSQARLRSDNGLQPDQPLVPGQALVVLIPQQTHTVQPGETLYGIAGGAGLTVGQLLRCNPTLTLDQPLFPGQVLTLRLQGEPEMTLGIGGYAYPYVDQRVLERALPFLSDLFSFSYGFQEDGTLVRPPDQELLALGRAYGAEGMLVLASLDENQSFSSHHISRFLREEALQEKVLAQLLPILLDQKCRGLDVDFEYIPPEDGPAFLAFLGRARDLLHAHGLVLYAALAPKTSAGQSGLLYEAHDYAAVGAIADGVLLMTYEWGYSYGPPMAVAPYPQVEQVLAYAVTEIPPWKIRMGLPTYGYDWTMPYDPSRRATVVGSQQAVLLAAQTGAEIHFDQEVQTPTFRYFRGGEEHRVWFEDARSLLAKLRLAHRFGLEGATYWNLMRPFAQNWAMLSQYVRVRRGD